MPTAPRRQHYTFGRLLTADDFEAEQSYLVDRRRSDNRHLHGWGVVCGLDVKPSGGGVVVGPGLAIDGLGREIVVPEPREMADPRRPVDDRGEPAGDPVDSDAVTICLAYAERSEDEDDRFVRETYRLEIRAGKPKRPARSEAAEAVLTGSPADVVRALCEATADRSCDPADECVPLATVTGRKRKMRVAVCPRRTIAPNDFLFDLILGLLRRIEALEREIG